MTPEQKQRIVHEISNWNNAKNDQSSQITGDRMAAMLQELIDAPEQAAGVPIDTRLKVKFGEQYGSILANHWFYLQPADEYASAALTRHTGDAVSEAPAVRLDQSEQHLEVVRDAERLRNFEQWADQGYAPCLMFDDDGHWQVSFDGMVAVGDTKPSSLSSFTHPDRWHDSVGAAIDAATAAIAAEKGGE